MNRSYARVKNPRYAAINDRLAALLDVVESADAAPTPQVQAEVSKLQYQPH
jgi:hypothetical protein